MNDYEVFIHYLNRLMELPVIKIIAGIFIWLLKFCFGSTFNPAYSTIFYFWIVDTGTGYYHARKNPEVKPESRKMYHGLFKLAIYFFLLSAAFRIGQCGINLITSVQTILEVSIILTELKSIIENGQKIAALKKRKIFLLDLLATVFEGKLNQLK